MPSDPVCGASTWIRAVLVWTALALGACGGVEPTPAADAGPGGRYVSVADGDTRTVLVLESGGGFLVLVEDRGRDRDRRMRPEPTPLAAGTWDFSDGRLLLNGDGWTTAFAADSTRVEVPRRAGTLSSLRWLTSSEGSPFDACDLVSASEFADLLNPPEGSGSSGW